MTDRDPSSFDTSRTYFHQLEEKEGRTPLKLSVRYREGQSQSDELVVFLHGLGCDKDSYKDMFINRDLQPFSLLAPDFAGFGDSSKPEDWSYTMEQQTETIAELLQHPDYKEKKLHIVGHSMGGVSALLLAEQLLQQGRGVESLGFVEGNLIAEDCGVLSRKSARVTSEDEMRATIEGFQKELGMASNTEGERQWAEQVKKTSPRAFQKSASSLVQWSDSGDLPRRFRELQIGNKYYIYGEKSSQWNVSKVKLKGELMGANIQLTGISGASHFVPKDKPKEFARVLAGRLKAA